MRQDSWLPTVVRGKSHALLSLLPAVEDKGGQIERNATNSRDIRENIHLTVQGVIGSKMIGDDVRQIMRREKVDDDENENHRDGEHRRASFDQHKDSPNGNEHNQQTGDHLNQDGKVGELPISAAEHYNQGKDVTYGDGEQDSAIITSRFT